MTTATSFRGEALTRHKWMKNWRPTGAKPWNPAHDRSPAATTTTASSAEAEDQAAASRAIIASGQVPTPRMKDEPVRCRRQVVKDSADSIAEVHYPTVVWPMPSDRAKPGTGRRHRRGEETRRRVSGSP